MYRLSEKVDAEKKRLKQTLGPQDLKKKVDKGGA